MGQQKGNPIPSPQNQAYEALRPNLGARANRDMGTKPVMIDDMTTLSEVVDLTFETDAIAAMISSSVASQLTTITSSVWAPTITSKNGLFNNAVNVIAGNYQKIGNIVNFTLQAEFQDPTSSQSIGAFSFDLPIPPNNNFSGSLGNVLATSTLYSGPTNKPTITLVSTVHNSKTVSLYGNRTNTNALEVTIAINGQYKIDN